MNTTHTIPKKGGGGPTLAEAEEKDLVYWLGRKRDDLAQSRFPERDQAWIEAAEAELAARKGGAPRPAPAPRQAPPAQQHRAAPAQSAAMARVQQGDALVSSRNMSEINRALQEYAQQCHLVTPATSCGSLPEGCEIAFSLIQVDPSTDKSGPGDVSPVGGGKLSLSGTVLKKIGAAAGVSWDMQQSGRLDDGSDPHYAHYRAVGHVRSFDGSVRTVSGEVEIDMRAGSPQIEAMYARSKEGANLDAQIRDTRLFLIRHAETKAKLRAIADLGLRRSYTAAELAKPFAVARIMFTGRTEDPELRRMFAEKVADAYLASSTGLYGAPPQAPAVRHVAPPAARPMVTHQAPAPQLPVQQWQGAPPPPVGSVPVDDDLLDEIPAARPTPRPAPAGDLGDVPDRGLNPDNY